MDEVISQLSNAKVFSVAGCKIRILACGMRCRIKCSATFGTPFGRYRWKQLPSGISVVPETFQKKLREIVEDVGGVYAIADHW